MRKEYKERREPHIFASVPSAEHFPSFANNPTYRQLEFGAILHDRALLVAVSTETDAEVVVVVSVNVVVAAVYKADSVNATCIDTGMACLCPLVLSCLGQSNSAYFESK